MLSKLRARRGLIGPSAVLTLVLAVAIAGVPAVAQPIATTSANLAKAVKKAFKLSNAASKRSARAVRIAREAEKQVGPQGIPGPVGSPGPKGERGEKGEKGVQGTPGVSGLEVVAERGADSAADARELTAQCPAGKKVFGGLESLELPKMESEGTQNVSDDHWMARAHEHTPTEEPWALEVYAICGNAT
jgi:hypothetical protein